MSKKDLIELLSEMNQISGSHLESVIYRFKNLLEDSALACCSKVEKLRPGVWKIEIDRSTCELHYTSFESEESVWAELYKFTERATGRIRPSPRTKEKLERYLLDPT